MKLISANLKKLLAAATVIIVATAASAAISTVVVDGAYCWFGDPRAIHHEGTFDRTFVGSITAAGSIQVTQYDHTTRRSVTTTLHDNLQVDDHDNPSILVRADKRLIVFYSKHTSEPVIYYRISTYPEDATSWQPEQMIATVNNVTYPNPVMLSGENNRIYLFTRDVDWKPTVQWSDDQGTSWSRPIQMLTSSGARPYMKVESNGANEIYFTFTDGHPRDVANNSVYYMMYRAGAFYKANGTQITTISQLPTSVTSADRVYNGSSSTGRGWVWDIAAVNGQPTITYARFPSTTNHQYRYAYWDGSAWQDKLVVAGGQWFPQTPSGKTEPEQQYSGGVVLDHGNPNVVYSSRPINGQWEIERRITTDHGATWTTTAITSNSTQRQVRPYVVKNYKPGDLDLIWMSGPYVGYTNYATGISTNSDLAQAPVLRFDMGTPTSPVASGFARVSENTQYGAGGYGWVGINAAANLSRDRGTSDPLTRDFIFNSATRTFKVALRNGTYTVKVTSGDAQYAHDKMRIVSNGVIVADNVDSPRGGVTISTFTVTVTGESLELQFSDLGGADRNWVVNAIEIQ